MSVSALLDLIFGIYPNKVGVPQQGILSWGRMGVGWWSGRVSGMEKSSVRVEIKTGNLGED